MSASPAPRSAEARGPAHAIVQRWLVGLRWVAFALLALTLPVGEHLFGFHVHYEIALPVVALAAIVNVFASRLLRHQGSSREAGPRAVAALVAFDLVAIGVVLAASGGAANPFSALFLVHVALAAAVLPTATTFALSGLAALVFAGLFALPAGSCCAAHARDGSFSNHLYGMWMAFVLCAGLVAFFVTRIRRALEAREAEVLRLRRETEHASRFASLGTLAAGTAHELGTPLGTIAVLAGEIACGAPASEARSHALAIADAVARCRDVISKMQAAAHASRAAAAPLDIAAATSRAADAFRAAHPEIRIDLDVTLDEVGAWAPIADEDFASALGVLLDNAAFASRKAGSSAPLTVRVAASGGRVRVEVEDSGTGVPETLIERLGEPFLTTKEPGEGMGLGLYLARGLLDPIGGTLAIANRPPRGARATIDLPAAPQPARASSPPVWADAAE
jgi:two-component system sensor histidine kinase RegB